MNTATLTRPALRLISLPANATWTEPQRPANVRPCETRPANWWDYGDPGNAKAKQLCATCPFQDGCKPAEDEYVAGTIRAGVAYDDAGRTAIPCRTCGDPIIRQPGNPICVNGHGSIAQHHEQIADMRSNGQTFQAIADALEVGPSAVSRYWNQYLARAGQQPTRVNRLPGVTDNSHNHPQDYHDALVAMLSDLNANYTYQEVAYAIGSTTDSVKSYWRRIQRRAKASGKPFIDRSAVPHTVNRRRARAVAP